MKKEDLKKIILEEAKYIKNLIEEKKQIEEKIKELEDDASCEESDIEETTGKGQGVNRRASHKGELGKRLKVEDELEEMMGLSQAATHQVGADTTNPVYKSRKKRGYVNEEQSLRAFIKNMLYESYGLKEGLEVSEYIVKVKHDEGTKKIRTSATSEEVAKEKVMKSEGCPKSAILSAEKA